MKNVNQTPVWKKTNGSEAVLLPCLCLSLNSTVVRAHVTTEGAYWYLKIIDRVLKWTAPHADKTNQNNNGSLCSSRTLNGEPNLSGSAFSLNIYFKLLKRKGSLRSLRKRLGGCCNTCG